MTRLDLDLTGDSLAALLAASPSASLLVSALTGLRGGVGVLDLAWMSGAEELLDSSDSFRRFAPVCPR
jgi:hypothetical protein